MGEVLAIRTAGRGRQPVEVEHLRDARDELTALIAEDRETALRGLVITRRAEQRVARGQSPADALHELESLFLRLIARLTAAGVEPRIHESCVDERAPGHGVAA